MWLSLQIGGPRMRERANQREYIVFFAIVR
jgi:hypothetical protein